MAHANLRGVTIATPTLARSGGMAIVPELGTQPTVTHAATLFQDLSCLTWVLRFRLGTLQVSGSSADGELPLADCSLCYYLGYITE